MGGAMAMEWDVLRVNAELLDEELKALGLACYAGLSTGGGKVRVHLAGEWTKADEEKIFEAVRVHKPDELSKRERRERDRRDLAAGLAKPWASWTDADKDRFLRLLAQEVIDGEI